MGIDALRSLVLELRIELESRAAEISHLKLVLAKLRRTQFGPKSEKLNQAIEQLELWLEELETEQAHAPAAAANESGAGEGPAGSSATSAPTKPARKPLPAHLPRNTRTRLPKEPNCSQCGGELRKIGEDTSETLEYVPAQFIVLREVRPKYTCACCDKMVQEEAGSRPIPRGEAGPGLLAHVLVAKYADHLPLHRQSGIYQRAGVELSRSTMADWVGQCQRLLAPLVEAVRRHVMSAGKLHADDTPVPVQTTGMGKTKTGRLWTYVRDDRPWGDTTPPAVWFAYSPDRKGEHPQRHLQDFQGDLQADAYAGFQALYDTGRVREASCWAHVRRKFLDLTLTQKAPVAQEALARIAQLYKIEEDIRGRSPDYRREQRQARARPLLDSMHSWFRETLTKLSSKSDTSAAVTYALNRWPSLVRYVDDGRLEIDNNAAERALRAVALGRKNYLFFGADSGGDRAAAMYTLLGSAKLNGLDPELYLREVLSRIADHPINRIAELLPWNLAVPAPGAAAAAAA
ncbi:MAG: IS66 family transposase [Acetobacteraceae bacterium]|nr:IS66 family transposase [Acetobacteraceae bacterium]